jgi:ABC-type multidrug transport system permease subunit
MGKLAPLVKANIKGLLRNWKSLLILVVLPLVLILIIFASFNPEGLRKIDIGYSFADGQTLDETQFNNAMGGFAKLHRFDELDDCLKSLRSYKEYVCVHIHGSGPYVLDVHYDNTREPVIWEIVQRLEQSVRSVQKQESKDIADDFLVRFRNAMTRLDAYDRQLVTIHSDIDTYIYEVDGSITKLQGARRDLITTLDGMDRDIAEAKSSSSSARSNTAHYTSQADQQLSLIDYNLQYIAATAETQAYLSSARSSIGNARSQVSAVRTGVESDLDRIDGRISSYQAASARGRGYVFEIDNSVNTLRGTKTDLQSYKVRVASTRNELSGIKQEFRELEGLDAETLVNPVVVVTTPTYIPQVSEELQEEFAQDVQAAAKGVSLISLQTIFPTVLILITLFLSLLIGSFVALGEINSAAHQRIRLVDHTFFPEFFASFISSLIIVFVPIFTVLLIGDGVFHLGVFEHIFTVTATITLVMAIFVLLGFLLAYIIRKESMALMTSTFILVLFIFLSGFLLPVERMSPISYIFATMSPGSLAVDMFKQSVFYDSGFDGITLQFMMLIGQFILLMAITLVAKYWRE